MSDDENPRSPVSDELDVPPSQPDPDNAEHVLSTEDLTYPTISIDSGSISPTSGVDLSTPLDRSDIQALLRDLDAALTSHDLCLEGPDHRAIFGLGPGEVSIGFDPDADQLGRLTIQIDLRAKALTYADVEARHVGARGGCGFIPKGMLTGEIDPTDARCYNWIEDAAEHLDRSE